MATAGKVEPDDRANFPPSPRLRIHHRSRRVFRYVTPFEAGFNVKEGKSDLEGFSSE